MIHTPRLFVPAITPLKRDVSVDTTRFVAHSRRLPEAPLMALTDAHRDQVACAKSLCFKGVPSV